MEKSLEENRFWEKRKAEERRLDLVLCFFVPVLAVIKKISQTIRSKATCSKSLPSGNIFWCVTTLSLVVENFSGRAAEFTWLVSVEANVELLAIFWVWEVGMGDDLTWLVVLALFFRALESVLQFFHGFNATFSVDIFWPDASSGVFIEVQTYGALVLNVFAVNAGVENVADGCVWMGEESVLSGAEVVLSLWWFCVDKDREWATTRASTKCVTYGVLFCRRSRRWRAGRTCWPFWEMDRRPDRRDRVSPSLFHRGTRSICRTAPHPRTIHFCRLGIEISASLENIPKNAFSFLKSLSGKKINATVVCNVLNVSRNCVIYLIMQRL